MKIESETGFRPQVIVIAFLYLALAALVFFFAFCNLDGRLFWGDEAETALLARSIVHHGVPRVDDGLNHIVLHGDRFDARDGVWTWSPWLPDYVTAASFALFGQTTWAGRAPFALCGWLAVLALGALAWKLYRSHRIALGAMFLLGTSEVFLLHLRQCRYYSLVVLAQILLLYGVYQMLKKDRSGPWLILAALVVQFYCNYAIAAANIPMLLVLGGSLFRQKKTYVLPLIASLGIVFVVCVPWLMFSEFWREAAAEPRDPWVKTLYYYAWHFHFNFLPWCVVLLPFSGWLIKRFTKGGDGVNTKNLEGPERRLERYIFWWPFFYTPVLLAMSGGYLRYILPLLPALCLLVVVWLFRHIKWTPIAVALLLVQCVSNVFAVATCPFHQQHTLRSPLADFVFSTLLPYQDRFTDVLDFLKTNVHPGDRALSWNPEFPLMFYAPVKIVDARLVASPFQPLPNWVMPVSLSHVFFEPPKPLPEDVKPYYQPITLLVHDSPRVDTIPEPDFYQSETTRNMAPFRIYELKSEAAPR
jgi:4-amino-4-deoxy-L-arabinose transferase-like glycosyltransferase